MLAAEVGLQFAFEVLDFGTEDVLTAADDADDGGFDFLSVNRTRTSTSGPEAGAALRWLLPVIGGFELLVEMNVSLAFFAFAPQLETPQAVVQPSASLSAGVGF